MSLTMIWIGMDVHKDTVMVAVYRGGAREAESTDDQEGFSRGHIAALGLPGRLWLTRVRIMVGYTLMFGLDPAAHVAQL